VHCLSVENRREAVVRHLVTGVIARYMTGSDRRQSSVAVSAPVAIQLICQLKMSELIDSRAIEMNYKKKLFFIFLQKLPKNLKNPNFIVY